MLMYTFETKQPWFKKIVKVHGKLTAASCWNISKSIKISTVLYICLPIFKPHSIAYAWKTSKFCFSMFMVDYLCPQAGLSVLYITWSRTGSIHVSNWHINLAISGPEKTYPHAVPFSCDQLGHACISNILGADFSKLKGKVLKAMNVSPARH